MVQQPLVGLGLLLLVASLVAIITRRLRLPYSVGLVAAGAAMALLPRQPDIQLTRDMIFYIFLPPLIFEAALQLPWRDFVCDLPLTLTLAFPGVALAATIVAMCMHWAAGWSWGEAALFGVLISATDPVSVIAAFRELRIDRRLSLIVESESLLNDAAAAVGFAVLTSVFVGQPLGPGGATWVLVWSLGFGVAAGAGIAGIALLLAGRTEDHLVEITLTGIAAYGSFLLAEQFHGSGVMASLSAGLVTGNVGWMRALSRNGRGNVLEFWEFAAFLVNSLVFILIGIRLGRTPLHDAALTGGIAIVAVLLGRATSVYSLAALFAGSRLALPFAHQHVLFWGGLRGALALALALALPDALPGRFQIVRAAFDVVAFSIVVQGLTMKPLISALRLRRET
jgi:CPA1 family monovalent cation:H+ antiporter